MGNAEFFAAAQVKIEPDASSFREQLKLDVQSAIDRAGIFKIPVQVELLAFRRKIQTQLREKPFDILVEIAPASLAGLREQVLASLAGVEVPVQVIPVVAPGAVAAEVAAATGGAEAGAGAEAAAPRNAAAEAAARQAAADEALGAIDKQLTEAQLAYAAALQESLSVEERDVRLKEALGLTAKADATAVEQLAAASQVENAALTAGLRPLQERIALLSSEIALARVRSALLATGVAPTAAPVVAGEEEGAAALKARQQITNQLRKPFNILVEIAPATLTKLREEVLGSLAGIEVPVNVVPVTGAAVGAEAAVAGAAAPAPRAPRQAPVKDEAAAATKRLTAVEKQLTEAELTYDAALADTLTDEQRDARLKEALAGATKAQKAATSELAAAYVAENEALFKGLGPLEQKTALLRASVEASIAAAVTTTGTAGGAAAAGTPAEQAAAAAQKARLGPLRALKISEREYAQAISATATAEERATGLEAARKAAQSGLRTTDEALVAAEVRRTEALTAGTEAEVLRNQAIEEALAVEQKRLAGQLATVEAVQLQDRALVQQAALQTATSDATKEANAALGGQAAALTKVSEVRALNNAQLAVEKDLEANVAAAKELQVAATRLEDAELLKEAQALELTNAGLLAQVQAERLLTEQRLKGLGPMNERIRQERQLGKGVAAAGLSGLGLRGAVLAASGPFLAGTAAVIGITKAVGAAAELQRQLAVFRVTAGATADEIDRVRKSAVGLGADLTLPGVNASDAASAMTELAKAGLSVQDALDGARGVLELSTAAQIDQADAANLVASALNAFGLSGTDAVRVADLLANASNLAQGGITDMGAALENSAAVARIAGVPIDVLVAEITELARAGRQGGEAGTTLRNAYLRLINPTDKARAALQKLRLETGEHVRVLDSAGRLNVNVFREIEQATERMTAAERNRTLGTIFSTRSIVAQGILGRITAQQLEHDVTSVNKAGAAQQLAGAQTEGFNGSLENLKNQLSTLGVNLGNFTLGPLQTLIDTAASGIGILNKLAEAAGKFPHIPALPAPPGLGRDEGEKSGISFGEAFRRAWETTLGSFGIPPPVKAKVKTDTSDIADEVSAILKDFNTGLGAGSETAAEQAIVRLRALVAELEKGDPAAQQLARDIQGVIDQLASPRVGDSGFLDPTARAVGEARDHIQDALRVVRKDFSLLSVDGQNAGDALRQALQISAGGSPQELLISAAAIKQIEDNINGTTPKAKALHDQLAAIVDDLLTAANLPPIAVKSSSGTALDNLDSSIQFVSEHFGELGTQIRNVQPQITDLFNAIAKGAKSPQELNAAADGLQKIRDNLDTSSPAAKTFANRLDSLIQKLRDAAHLAPIQLPDVTLPPSLQSGQTAQDIADSIKDPLKAALTGQPVYDIGTFFMDILAQGAKDRARKVGQEIADTLASGVSLGLSAAEATGDTAAELAFRQRKLARDRARLAVLLGRVGLPATATPEQVQAQVDAGKVTELQRKKIQAAFDAITKGQNEIDSIHKTAQSDAEARARDAEQRKNKIIQAQNKHDQNIIDSFGRVEARATLNQAHIEATERLSDDIKLSNTLIALYKKERANAAKNITNEQTRTQVVAEYTRRIKDEQQHRRDLLKEKAKNDKQARDDAAKDRQDAIDRVEQILNLNVQIAEAKGNKTAEAKALNAEIDFYKRQIKAAGKNELLRKQYMLKLVQAQNQLKDLKDEIGKTKNAFQSMAFEFLTTQQGFAATLLGNLLPTNALAGTVGGTAGPATGLGASPSSVAIPGIEAVGGIVRGQSDLTGQGGGRVGGAPGDAITEAAKKAAAAERGPSHVQSQRQIALLTQIVNQLVLFNARTKHPEAKNHQKSASTHMDTRGV